MLNGPPPRWSVMIPSHRNFEFLEATLQSVLDVGDELGDDPQIVVVDDNSPSSPESIVQSVGAGLVDLVEHRSSLGAIGNFNSCVDLAEGDLIHILHSDDAVLPGFYTAATAAFDGSDVGLFAARCRLIDEHGAPSGTASMAAADAGVWSDALSTLGWRNPLRFPGVAVRRSAYEQVGPFSLALPHTADWEMWARLAAASGAWWEPTVLASYREHSQSDTATLTRSARNSAERLDCVRAIAPLLPADIRSRRVRMGHAYSSFVAARCAASALASGQFGVVAAQGRQVVSLLARAVVPGL